MPVGLYAGANVSNGNGVTLAFPYNFKILDQTHIEVKVDGVVQPLGAYSVTGVGLSNGGNVVFLVAPANGAVVQRARKVPYKRDQDYQYNGDLREEVVDPDLDSIEMQVQQVAADIARCFKAPLSVTADQVSSDADWAAAAGKFMRRKNDGSGIEFVAASPSDNTFTATGVGAVARSWSSKVGEVLSVKDFAAVGNGVIDDRANIQKCIDVGLASGAAVFFPTGVYRITSKLALNQGCTLEGAGICGERIYADGSVAYGGAEIWLDAAPADRLAENSFAISINTGGVGAEGFARVRVRNLGVSWNGLHAGGIYVQGADGIVIEDCWLTGGLTNHDAGTADGFCILTKDMICSLITRCTFIYSAYGIVADSYFNENAITHNDFQHIKEVCVLLRGRVSTSIRSSISDNNFFGDGVGDTKYGVYITGDTRDVTIERNTFEVITHGPVVVTGGAASDYLDATNNGTPAAIHVHKNTFIATNGGVAGQAIFMLCAYGTVSGNALKNASVGVTAMIGVNAAASDIWIWGNDPEAKPLFTGAGTKTHGVEFSFTPTLTFGGAAVGLTTGVATGTCRRWGKRVEVSARITLTAKGASVGQAKMGSLPFVAANNGMNYQLGCFGDTFAAAVNNLNAQVEVNASTVQIARFAAGARTLLTDADFTNTSDLQVNGVFETV